MARKKNAIPSLTLHKPTGQGRVRINGRDFYCGAFGSRECQERYAELIREFAREKTVAELPTRRKAVKLGKGLLVAELVADYAARRILTRYVDADGKLTNEGQNQQKILRDFREAIGTLPVADVTGVSLMAVRDVWIKRGLKRGTVNRYLSIVKRLFKWGLANELVPPDVFAKIDAVDPLARGDDGVVENGKVKPVAKEHVDAILPYLPSPIRAVVKLQSLTGARGGEILIMRRKDIDMTGDVWWYQPESHKTAHHGKERLIPLGSNAQSILAPFLDRPDGRYLFRPAEAVAERAARKREDRKTRVQPSQQARAANAKGRKYQENYSSNSYRQAITYAIRAANRDHKAAGLDPIPEWHPHQLRHAAATAIRKTYGVEVASVMLGHSSVAMTELYAEKNRDLAQRVASEIG